MEKFIEEVWKKHKETVQQRKKESKPIDKICIDQKPTKKCKRIGEGDVNHRLAAVVTRYIHQVIMQDKKQFYSGNILGKMFEVPPSTLNKLISGRKYIGSAELKKYREVMKRKGVDIPKRLDMKLGDWKVLEQPKPSTSTSSQVIMKHN